KSLRSHDQAPEDSCPTHVSGLCRYQPTRHTRIVTTHATAHLHRMRSWGMSRTWRAGQMKQLIALVAAVFAVSLAGCNTMAGAGRDIAKGGQKIEDAAYKTRADWRIARDRNERE